MLWLLKFQLQLSAYKVSLAWNWNVWEKNNSAVCEPASLHHTGTYFTIKANIKLLLSLVCAAAPGQSPLLTSSSCLVESTGSGCFYVWSMTASYYPITSLHPSCPHTEADRGREGETRHQNSGSGFKPPETSTAAKNLQIWTRALPANYSSSLVEETKFTTPSWRCSWHHKLKLAKSFRIRTKTPLHLHRSSNEGRKIKKWRTFKLDVNLNHRQLFHQNIKNLFTLEWRRPPVDETWQRRRRRRIRRLRDMQCGQRWCREELLKGTSAGGGLAPLQRPVHLPHFGPCWTWTSRFQAESLWTERLPPVNKVIIQSI